MKDAPRVRAVPGPGGRVLEPRRSDDVLPVPGSLVERALLTGAAVLAVIGLGHLPLPGLDPQELGLGADNARRLSAGALGLTPFLTGYLVIEWIALAVPGWRRRRNGNRAERRALTRSAWVVGALLVAVQAIGVVAYLRQLRSLADGSVVLGDGGALPAVALLAGGSLVPAALAVAVDRRGLGSGWVLLPLGVLAEDAVRANLRLLGSDLLPASGLVMLAAGPVAVVWLVARVVRRPVSPGTEPAAVRVPVPTCGIVPLQVATGLLTSAVGLASALQLAVRGWLLDGATPHLITLVLAGGLALTLPAFFNRPDRVARGWERLAGPDAAAMQEPVRRALSEANRRSALLVTGLAALPLALFALAVPFSIGVGGLAVLAVAAAVALDLAADVRTFTRPISLSSLRPLHRVHAVEPVVAELGAAGIEASVRSLHVRALLQFFGPYAPVEILVPSDRAEEASAILERILD